MRRARAGGRFESRPTVEEHKRRGVGGVVPREPRTSDPDTSTFADGRGNEIARPDVLVGPHPARGPDDPSPLSVSGFKEKSRSAAGPRFRFRHMVNQFNTPLARINSIEARKHQSRL
jgi:hypothetical protein